MNYGLFVKKWKLNEFDGKPILYLPLPSCSNCVNNSPNYNNYNGDNYNSYEHKNNLINNYEDEIDMEMKFNVVNKLISTEIHLNPSDKPLLVQKNNQNNDNNKYNEYKDNKKKDKEDEELMKILMLNKRVRELTRRNESEEELGVTKRRDMEEDLKVLKGMKLKRRIQVPITFKTKRLKGNKSVPVFNSVFSSVIMVCSRVPGESVGLSVNRFEDTLRLGEEVELISKRYLNN